VLITNPRVILLDESTQGLDSAVSYDLLLILKDWAALTGATVVANLLSLTPECFNLFADLIVLNQGRIIYQGQRAEVSQFLAQSWGIAVPQEKDLADFLIELLADPLRQYAKQKQNPRAQNELASAINTDAESSSNLCISLEKQIKAYQSSSYFEEQQSLVSAATGKKKGFNFTVGSYSSAQYNSGNVHSFWFHTSANIERNFILLKRDRQFTPTRIIAAIIMPLLFGSLFYQLDKGNYYSRLGVLVFVMVQFCVGAITELPNTIEIRDVAYKHVDAQFYPVASQIIATNLSSLPVSFIESLLFAVILYFFVGFYNGAAQFILFFLILLCMNLMFSSSFRAICLSVLTADEAQNLGMPLINLSMIFSGFIIFPNVIKNWQIEFFWLSPFAWALRGLAINEFSSPDYDEPLAGQTIRRGDVYMDSFDINKDKNYIWAALVYLLGLVALAIALASYWLKNKRFSPIRGTKRVEYDYASDSLSTAQLVVDSSRSVLPFRSMNLSWHNINYHVTYTDKVKKETVTKHLLKDVNGFVAAGSLVALMGSSGAGKTTLMDCLAGRKTTGKLTGEIRFNGQLKTDLKAADAKRIIGFAEQEDNNAPLLTVRESLLFAAELRLPKETTREIKIQFVEELLDLIELRSIADKIVGNSKYSGLSASQLKLLTIGVELAANTSILFCDEPTSSLDAKSAFNVMRVVKNIAATGRTVLCTIHQPSADIVYLFDSMLVLQSGGEAVYFGEIGEEAKLLTQYFESIPNNGTKPIGMNPATWMLERISKAKATNIQFLSHYQQSPLSLEQRAKTERFKQFQQQDLIQEKSNSQSVEYGTSITQQLKSVWIRTFKQYWRDPIVNLGRLIMFTGVCLIFSIVFVQIDANSYAGVNSKMSALFMINGFLAMSSALITLPNVMADRAYFYREQASNTYSSWVYSSSLIVAELFASFISMILPVILAYFIVGYRNDAALFFQFYLIAVVLTLCQSALGLLAGALFPNFVAGIQFIGFIAPLQFLMGGIFTRAANIPSGWKWFYYLNPIPKSVIAIILPQFECSLPNPYDINSGCPTLFNPQSNSQQTIHAYVQEQWDTSYDNAFGRYAGWLVLTWAVTVIAVITCFRFVNHLKR
jgi:ABC-type multidrug transport system ATPase subunit/ABC-type multidrug transport system permease subunit